MLPTPSSSGLACVGPGRARHRSGHGVDPSYDAPSGGYDHDTPADDLATVIEHTGA